MLAGVYASAISSISTNTSFFNGRYQDIVDMAEEPVGVRELRRWLQGVPVLGGGCVGSGFF